MAEEKDKEEKKQEEQKQPQEKYNVVEVPTQTAYVIHDSEGDNVLNDKSVQAEILNRLARIEKLLG